jgi:hypothetical protein
VVRITSTRRIGDPGAQAVGDAVAVVGDDVARGQDVPCRRQPVDQRVARAVFGQAAGIGHGQDGDADGEEGPGGVDPAHR